MLAVILLRFNPCGFGTPTQNYRETLRHLRHHYDARHIFPLELLFDGEQPVDPNAVRIRGTECHKYIFQKEVLFNQFVRGLPGQYDNVALFDSDLWFTRTDWAEQIEQSLRTADIIQAFDQCHWLDQAGQIVLTRKSNTQTHTYPNYPNYHPGFAWAMRRDLFDRMGGLFDYNIVGGGDGTFCWSLMGDPQRIPDGDHFPDCLLQAITQYRLRIQQLRIRLGHAPGAVIHRWHGDRKNRRYCSRHLLLKQHQFRLDDIALDGLVWRWNTANQGLQDAIKELFLDRKEDG